MLKNDAGLTILEKGDIVRIGKGKVLYTVEYGETAGMIHVRSHNTGKSVAVERERLSLVESVQSVAYTAGCSVEELNLPVTDEGTFKDEPVNNFAPEWPKTFSDEEKAAIMRDVDGDPEPARNDHRESSYGKAILRALNTLGKHVYSGTAKDKPKRKAKRMAKVARRQARKGS